MARKQPDPLAPGFPPLTPAQLRYVNQQTRASVAPERQAILAQQRAAQRQAAAEQDRIVGFSKAAAELLGKQVPQVSAAYDQAVQNQQGLASGFSQDMRDRLANVPGAPQGASDATYALGGYIPGSRLGADAVSQLGLAQSQPATQLGLGQAGLRSAIARAAEGDKQFQDALVAVAAKVPGIRQQIEQGLRDYQLQARAVRDSEIKLGIDQQQFNASLNADNQYKNARLQQYQQQINQKQAQIAAGQSAPNASLSGKYGYIVDSQGNAILGKDGKKIPIVKKASGSGTASERHPVQAATVELRGLLDKTYVETPSSATSQGAQGKYIARPGQQGVFPATQFYPATTNNPAWAQRSMSVQEATNYVMTAYGLTRRQARTALAGAGWFKPVKKKANTDKYPSGQGHH